MKIGLYAKHAGLIDLLYHLWNGKHDVRLAPRWDGFEGHKTWQGDEDIIVSTLPYDTESLTTGKPTIVYYTDPTFVHLQKEVQRLFDEKKITVVGAEDCYLPEHFINGVEKYIPFAIKPDRYPKHSGHKPEVIIVNQKPYERWEQVVRGATGVFEPLETYLEGIPFRVIDEDLVTKFRQNFADARAIFYYSNSPYTIVMFEAMTVGIPIVAFNHHHSAKAKPIEKYLIDYSTDKDTIRKLLRYYLEAPTSINYVKNPDFVEIQMEWEKLFEEVMNAK